MFLDREDSGRRIACKVFGARGLTRLVQFVFLGSPNPYVWNEDAVRCALLRRRILARLVAHWFAGRLRVADAVDLAWNEEHRAFELRAEFSPGVPPPLHHPRRAACADPVRELVREVLPSLQERLIEAGFHGQVWQAGLGNPVALNNFLLERSDAGEVAARAVRPPRAGGAAEPGARARPASDPLEVPAPARAGHRPRPGPRAPEL